MKVLSFEGYSDDTFGEYGQTNVDFDNRNNGEPIIMRVWSPREKNGLFVIGQYCPGPVTGWAIGVGRLSEDDDDHLPDWPMKIVRSGKRSYTPSLHIEAPDDATVTVYRDDDGGRDEV